MYPIVRPRTHLLTSRFLLTAISTIACLCLSLSSVFANTKFHLTLWEQADKGTTFTYKEVDASGKEGAAKKITPYVMQRGKALQSAVDVLNIYATKDGSTTKIASAVFSTHKDAKQQILLLRKSEEVGYTLLQVPDNDAGKVWGQYAFYNLTEFEIKGKLGDSDITLAPNASQKVKPADIKDASPLPFELFHEPKGRKKYLQRNTFSFSKGRYLIIFLYPVTTASGKIHVKSKGISLLKQ